MKLTNALTKFEPTFHQNPMSPAILELIEKTNHLIICAPKHRNPQTSAEH